MLVLLIAACVSKEPFATVSENDAPRILNTDIPEWSNGEPSQLMSIDRKDNFIFTIIATPVHFTKITWNIDGKDVFEGNEINMPLVAGLHKVIVKATTTKGLSTSRTFTVAVRPSEGDPVLTDISTNRLAAPGRAGVLEGVALAGIKKVILGDISFPVASATNTRLDFTIPVSISDGVYSVALEDVSGTLYGGVYMVLGSDGARYHTYTISVSRSPFVTETALSCKAGTDVTLTGINLDNVHSLSIDGQNAVVVSKEFASIVFTCPSLKPGDYSIKGKANDGSAVIFGLGESAVITITSETTLWEGNFNVTWATPFNLLQNEFPKLVSAGTIVRAYVSGSGQGCMTTSWWNNILTGKGDPERGDISITGEQVLEYILTDYSMQLMAEQQGALFVGDGYTINRITTE